MPGPVLPPELRTTVSIGVRDLKATLDEPAGRSALAGLTQVRMGLTADVGRGVKPQSMKAATATLALIGTLPAELVSHADAPLLDPGSLSGRQALTAGAAAAQVLALGAESLLTGVRGEDSTPDSIVHAALGADRLSVAVRRAVVDPKLPLGLPPKVGIDLARLTKLARAGALRDYLDAFRRCGAQARTDRAWLAAVTLLGQVKGLDPATACAGDKLRIDFTGFGATAPDPTQVGDILVADPDRPRLVHAHQPAPDQSRSLPGRRLVGFRLGDGHPAPGRHQWAGRVRGDPAPADRCRHLPGRRPVERGRGHGRGARTAPRTADRDRRGHGRGPAVRRASGGGGPGRRRQPADRRPTPDPGLPRGRERMGAPARHGHHRVVHVQRHQPRDRRDGHTGHPAPP